MRWSCLLYSSVLLSTTLNLPCLSPAYLQYNLFSSKIVFWFQLFTRKDLLLVFVLIVNEVYLRLRLLVAQKKQSEDVTLDAEKFWAFFKKTFYKQLNNN